jgi:hypothetical protein
MVVNQSAMGSHVRLGDLQRTTMSKAKSTDDKSAPPAKEYRYATEISQMVSRAVKFE